MDDEQLQCAEKVASEIFRDGHLGAAQAIRDLVAGVQQLKGFLDRLVAAEDTHMDYDWHDIVEDYREWIRKNSTH